LNLPFLHKHLAGHAQRLKIMHRGSAAFRLDVFGNQLINRRLTFILSECSRSDDGDGDETEYKAGLHVI
jgi:hypothetical protein